MAEPSLEKLTRLAGLPQPLPVFGQKILPLPAPPRKTAAMMTAHRISDMENSLAHATERMQAARKTRDPELRKYEVTHIRNHLSRVLEDGHMLADNLRRHYPAEGKELDATVKTLGLAKSLSPAIKAATTAHLLQTTLNESTHAIRHAILMSRPDPAAEWEFNADHAEKHMRGALEHVIKLGDHITDNYPAEAGLLAELHQLRDGDHKKASYVKNAAPAAWPSGKPYAKSFLSPQRDGPKIVSAPGAGTFAYGQLKQEPSQTVSPSPPLPPSVPLPSPKELRDFARALGKMTDDESNHHLRGAIMHLESAAEKMPNNPTSALACLRSAQTAIQQEWRYRISTNQPRMAYVFSANTPPAEQSSQQQMWAKAQSEIGQMQGAAVKVAEFIDRVRRAYFGRMGMENQTAGGGLAGQPNARLAADGLDRVIRLATEQVRPFTRVERGRQQQVRSFQRGQPYPDAAHMADHLRNAHGVNLVTMPGSGEPKYILEELESRHQYLHSSGISNTHTHSIDPDASQPRSSDNFEAEANSLRPADADRVGTRYNAWGLPDQHPEEVGRSLPSLKSRGDGPGR